MPRSTSALVIALTLLATAACGRVEAAEGPRPSWECLPEDTAVMVRLPDPAGFLDAIRTRTKFGGIVLTDDRLRAGWNLFLDKLKQDGAGERFEELEKSLAKYGLERDDVEGLLRGDAGVGFVVAPRDDGLPPLTMMLAWLEPGEEPAMRLFAAAKQRLEEEVAKPDGGVRRIDVEMAGHDVVWAMEPVLFDPKSRRNQVRIGFGADGADGLLADPKADEEGERVQSSLAHAFITRIGGRLVVGQSIPTVDGKPAGENPDFDRISGTDDLKGIFERFLARHAADEPSPVVEIMRMTGIAATLPEGLPLVEVLVDPRTFVRAAGAAGNAASGMLKMVGAEQMGPFAWRQAFADGRWRSGMFLSMPAPRESLMRILDQDCDPSEVPSFVTTDTADLTQISLDLGKAYETVREFVAAVRGPEGANMFAAVEAQAQAVLGIDMAKALSSLGSRHWIVSYPSNMAEAIAAARKAEAEGGGQQTVTAQISDRMAIVWQVEDEEPFARLLKQLAPMAGGEMQEEQGFRGIRLPNGPAVYVGRNHLVVAIGGDSLERTLSAIRTPPAGDASLRESAVVRKAAELLPLEPARMFGIGDATRSGGTLGMLRDAAAAMLPEDVEPPYRDLLARLQALLPTATEVEGMFGVGVTLMRVEDAGISLESVWEMPAP
jgi:hypothetical protein